MQIAILGAGMVGRAMAIDLAAKYSVTSFDVSGHALEILTQKNKNIKTIKTDLSDYPNYETLLKGFDFVISAVPGFMGYLTLEAIINAKKNVVDISFFPENALELDDLAKENHVTAIVDCGVAPGMSNLILGYHNERMKITNFECMVGGLPKKRVYPFEYKAPFSPIDVLEEYTRPDILHHRQQHFAQTFSLLRLITLVFFVFMYAVRVTEVLNLLHARHAEHQAGDVFSKFLFQ